jgi:hypothetical protein
VIFQNTFETFGDPCPAEVDSKRDYAQLFLLWFFERDIHGNYIVTCPSTFETGYTREIEWKDRLWRDAVETEDEDVRVMGETELLDHLIEAVEETR